LWRAVGDVRSLVYALICLSEAALALGKTGEAMTLAGEASRLSEASRDRWSQASGLKLMGRAQLASGKPDEAAEYFRRAASTGREIGDRWATGQALTLLGRAALESGDATRARAAFEQAVALALEAETTPVGLEALLGLAEVRVMDCCPQEAIEIAFFVAEHPSAGKDAREWAARMAAQLGRGLNGEQVEAARRKAAGGTLQGYLAPEDDSENADAGL